MIDYLRRVNEFEALWANYIAKVKRLEELKEQGRYGYQLRMPMKSIRIAKEKLDKWCDENNEERVAC